MKKIIFLLAFLILAFSSQSFAVKSFINGALVYGVVKSNASITGTNSFHTMITNVLLQKAMPLALTNDYAVGITKLSTNTALTRSLRLVQTNAFHGVIRTELTNKVRSMFSNVISIQNTNKITIANYNRATNWILYISNQQVKVIKK